MNIKDINSMVNNYHIEKSKRKQLPKFKQVKPVIRLAHKYNTGAEKAEKKTNTELFLKQNTKFAPYQKHIFDNPMLEYFITSYMEETQDQINDYIDSEQFKSIIWNNGLPNLLIDVLSYLSDCPTEVHKIFAMNKNNI